MYKIINNKVVNEKDNQKVVGVLIKTMSNKQKK